MGKPTKLHAYIESTTGGKFKSFNFNRIDDFHESALNNGLSRTACGRFNKDGVRLIRDGVLSNKPLKEEEVIYQVKKLNSRFLLNGVRERMVGMYNMENKIIATFINPAIAAKITGFNYNQIYYMLQEVKEPKGDYTFKYIRKNGVKRSIAKVRD